jgi:hypothetical protein
MTYAVRTHLAASAIVPSADYNQGMDNEAALKAAVQPVQFTMIFDGGGATVAASTKVGLLYKMPTMTVTYWDMAEISASPAAGSLFVNLWSTAGSLYNAIGASNSLVGSGSRPYLTAGSIHAGASPAGWTSATITNGDYVIGFVDSASAGNKVALTVYGTRAV